MEVTEMSFRSKVVEHVIPLPEGVVLQDGTEVLVEVLMEGRSRKSEETPNWLLDNFPVHGSGVSSTLRREEIYGDAGR